MAVPSGDISKEYERLFRNVLAFFSGDMDQDHLLTGVSAEGLFAQRPELQEELEKALAKTHPRFAESVRYTMNVNKDK